MSKPEFYNNQFKKDAVFVLSTEAPFFIGTVMLFRSSNELADFIAKRKAIDGNFIGSRVSDYNILIILSGALMPYSIPREAQEVIKIYEGMANFYLTEKILPSEKYYSRKYKEAR